MSTFLSLSLSLGQGLSLYLSISISLCLYMEIIVGIGLCGYGGREVPQWIMYVLKSQESRGVLWSKPEGLRTRGW